MENRMKKHFVMNFGSLILMQHHLKTTAGLNVVVEQTDLFMAVAYSIRLVLFLIFLCINKSDEKTKSVV